MPCCSKVSTAALHLSRSFCVIIHLFCSQPRSCSPFRLG
jgi:hypothetical protein